MPRLRTCLGSRQHAFRAHRSRLVPASFLCYDARMRGILALSVLALSCAQDEDPSQTPAKASVTVAPAPAKTRPAKPVEDAPADPSTEAYMHRHLRRVRAARDLLIFSDLSEARRSLRWLSERGAVGTAQEDWEPFTRRFQAISASGAEATTRRKLALRIAELSRECGRCHENFDVVPRVPTVDKPPRGREFQTHMRGHKWAIDHLWAGLVVPSEASWQKGLRHLARSPSHLKDVRLYGDAARKAIAFADGVHLRSQKSRDIDPDDRVRLFGEVLAACSGCHALREPAPRSLDSDRLAPNE